MTKKSYYELLKHPKWQKKRLEILERDGFQCQDCGSEDKTLHVHHGYYEKGFKPWEYPDESLHALCEDCHADAQRKMRDLHRQIGRLAASDLDRLHGFALGVEALCDPWTVLSVYSWECAFGVGAAWNLAAEEVISSLESGEVDGYKLHDLAVRLGRRRSDAPPTQAKE